MKKHLSRFVAMGIVMAIMMGALIWQLGQLTIVQGESYAEAAASRSTRTVYEKGARGSILDRNGIVLAYDETSYNIEFYRDPEKRTNRDRALYTESLLEAIKIIEAGGGQIIDSCYIQRDEETGEIFYEWGVTNPDYVAARFKNFREGMGFTAEKDQNISAEEAYRRLRISWQIPTDLPFEDAVKLMSIWQEVALNGYRSYMPITIAYNVPMEVVAQIEMRKSELRGVQTQKSTKRVYPRGTTAAHILGYLSRQVTDKMDPAELERLGFTKEDYQNAINSDGTVDMTQMGYSYGDYIGVAGVERTMESVLTSSTKNRLGTKLVETNMHGTIIREMDEQPYSNGNDVMLTIDLPLQEVTEAALKEAIETIQAYEIAHMNNPDNIDDYLKLRPNGLDTIKTAEAGAIVVLDVETGKTLAIASYPTFDPNEFIAGLSDEQAEALFGEDSNMPTLNRAIATRTMPGSIFKMTTGLAGLMEGTITTETQISDESPYYLTDEEGNLITQNAPKCWTSTISDHANLSLSGALTHSCNYFFYWVAERLGISKIDLWGTKLGLTSKTGIELPGELTGYVGGQSVLYDNTLPIDEQKSSLPGLVYRRLQSYLKDIMALRGVQDIDEEVIKTCAERLMKLQDGQTTELGPGIRRVLREELGIPEGLTESTNQVWVNDIRDFLVELQWKATFTIRTGIGQAVARVTPVAISRYMAALANGGTVFDVHIVDRIIDSVGNIARIVEPTVHEQIDAPEEYWQAIRKGLEGVVSPEDRGTAAAVFTDEFKDEGYLARISGKSGTAQISETNNVDIENTSWFVTLAPKDDPEIAIVVYIPYGFSGSRGGSPAVEKIVRFYLDRKDSAAPENLVDINGLTP